MKLKISRPWLEGARLGKGWEALLSAFLAKSSLIVGESNAPVG